MSEKLMVAVVIDGENFKPVIDQNNTPIIVTLAEALKMKFEDFPFAFAPLEKVFVVTEIEIPAVNL